MVAFLGRLSSLSYVMLLLGSQAVAQDEPWREPQDTAEALIDPDLYAWRLFVALNWPADVAQREADPARPFGEHGDVVWESWKFSSGELNEVFLDRGLDPGPWMPGRVIDERRLEDFEPLPVQQQIRLRGKGLQPTFDPSTSAVESNENHMNRAAYEFIRERELYNVEGQESLFADAAATWGRARAEGRPADPREFKLDFPLAAKEVKAQWRPIEEAQKPRYHWHEFTDAHGDKLLFGLTALHVTTKDLPNWFWATFEHVDNPEREGAEPWLLPSRDTAAGPDGYPPQRGIEGTPWQYYRLRGTQIEFVDSTGNPTLLANAQIEQGFQTTSSCIACHARATIEPASGSQVVDRLAVFERDFGLVVVGSVGAPDPGLFDAKQFIDPVTGQLRYLQLDFVWSLSRARRKIAE